MSEMLQLYRDSGALLEGHFILSSGRHSPQYLQSAKVLMKPKDTILLAARLLDSMPEHDFQYVVSPALGGLIIGYELARQLNKPFIFTERQNGDMCLRRGFSFQPGSHVLVVEDVVTTGGSVCECMNVVQKHGATPVMVVALVDRAPSESDRFTVPLHSLIKMEVPSYQPETCPLCAAGQLEAIKPGSRSGIAIA